MTGEGLEPSTNGLTYLIGSHRPRWPACGFPEGNSGPCVESLDYLFAVAGVPRLVSEAGANDPLDPLPADYPIPLLFDLHARRCRPRCGEGVLRASQHTAAFTRRGSASSRARLHANLAFEVRCSTD